MNKEITSLTNEISTKLLSYLLEQVNSKSFFKERRFYADTFLAASLSLLNKEELNKVKLINNYIDNIKKTDDHIEFNFFALKICGLKRKKLPKFKTPFFRKATNWVLLRSLIRYQQGGFLNKLVAYLQTFIITKINSYRGYFTDNSIRMFYMKNKNISSQYHAFSTALIGELLLTSKSECLKNLFLKRLETVVSEISSSGKFEMQGRGKQQIFGYASAILSISIGYKLTRNKKYLKLIEKMLLYIKNFQKENGYIPLALVKKGQESYWMSYNNLYDYQTFLLLFLIKSLKYLK